jgi:hypothetical protein
MTVCTPSLPHRGKGIVDAWKGKESLRTLNIMPRNLSEYVHEFGFRKNIYVGTKRRGAFLLTKHQKWAGSMCSTSGI